MKRPVFLSGIRGKLVAIFVVIKVVPLVILAWFAWHATRQLGYDVSEKAGSMAESMLGTINTVGTTVTEDSIRALDQRSREAIEALTTDAAQRIAAFLYARDRDILAAARLPMSESFFNLFLENRSQTLYQHGKWVLSADGKSWVPANPVKLAAKVTRPVLADNAKDFHARPPEYLGEAEERPLFVEMTFVDLKGQEKIKVTRGNLTDKALRNVADPKNTFVRAENYFAALTRLKAGEVYVSEVVGAYVKPHVIGPYTTAALAKAGKPFVPEQSAYAGTENPVGKRFRGIVRWATPVVQGGRITGYVTLALDHDHIRQFSDRVMPTEERYTPIADAIKGNYAFIWDHKSRSISHPRDYFIVGYNPETGQPETPWMDEELYAEWQKSGKPSAEFLAGVPAFRDQNLKRRPAAPLIKAGTVALDCRYLNFSPQCDGWNAVTEHGGSGSFVIFFSGLWKLTTAAAIPYYTGQYGQSRQGFGFVTIGANVDDFHKAATETATKISALVSEKDKTLQGQRQEMLDHVGSSLTATAIGLWGSTVVMVIVVIAIAVWMANFLTSRITAMIGGIHAFEGGDRSRRLVVASNDEMGELARSFNTMADTVAESFQRLEEAKEKAEEANRMKSEFLASMSHELRTPLNGILGFSELLEAELADPAQQEYARMIGDSGRHLLELVNEILDLSKVEAGKMVFTYGDIPLARFVEDCVGLYRGPAGSKGLAVSIEFSDDLPDLVRGDVTRLRQIVNNLLSNAVKFTEEGGIVVRVSASDEEYAIAVKDTGPGIPPEAHALVFEKFKQLDEFVTRPQEGTGLGLALARQLAERMGGRITLESVAGAGSTFTVKLPRKEVHG